MTAPDPILNGPYDPPTVYAEMGPHGPTGTILDGRRPSESFIPIAASRKGKGAQEVIDFDLTGERRQRNDFVNDLRRQVEQWRHRDYERVTPTTRTLLEHWADPNRENRVLFCQREAAETAIFLAEVAGRHGYADWRRQLEDSNTEHNADLPRTALKMATGSGKTVVMAMLIAWQTANKVAQPRDARFAKKFLVVTPGITIRDRLRVLHPGQPANYYDERDLVPPGLKSAVLQAQIVIENWHAFQPRDAKEIKGVAVNTRKILRAGKPTDAFIETPDAMVSRVLRDLGGTKTTSDQIVVFNDEAHHCYQDRPASAAQGPAQVSKEDLAEARVWFRGLQAVHRRVGIKQIYDLSATPFYLGGSGYQQGYLFPWVVSDFSLMDAIESGIVKIPRIPVDDDATHELVTYLRLWDFVGGQLPKRAGTKGQPTLGWTPPKELEGALHSLYRSYARAFEHWERELAPHGEPPPVFIVVCPNTVVSKLVHNWIAGAVGEQGVADGSLPLLANVTDGQSLARPHTILIDSAQLESGEAFKADFKQAAAAEIDAFKAEYRLRNPGADADAVTDEDLLREVMNTVGKAGRLGEQIRCVVSVAMLTEGWDANTVTHILGIRAFGSQLLCEQVVGRGLRRRSYALNGRGQFEAEYANVYGIPFAFLPSDRPAVDPLPRPPAQLVESLPGRERFRITFPRLVGYRIELPDAPLLWDPASTPRFVIGPSTVPTTTVVAPLVGLDEIIVNDPQEARDQQVAFVIARRLLHTHLTVLGDPRPWLFPQLLPICRDWLRSCVDVADGYTFGHLLTSTEKQAEAAEAIYNAIIVAVGIRRERLRPMLRLHDNVGSTARVGFLTRKAVEATEKSEISHVTLDGKEGNTWEQILALACELDARVAAYVKNDRLDFTIPYVHQGRTHNYHPDFLVRLEPRDDDPLVRTLVVEVSGGQKSPGPTRAKAQTARDSWCVAVNNHGGFGRWGYVEIKTMEAVRERLGEAIELLYADGPVVGHPDRLDLQHADRCTAGGAAVREPLRGTTVDAAS